MARPGVSSASPLVSVIIPAWNAEKTLPATLQSAAAQTYRNVEILIIDDGSTDGTAEIAAEFCRAHQQARYLRKRNGGVASARNLGIGEAKGEWIAPLDADDLWHPTRIEKMIAAALAVPERVGFTYCWQRVIDERGRVVGSEKGWAFSGPAFLQLSYINAVGGGSGLLLERSALRKIGGYDESLHSRNAQGCEDVMVQLQVARNFPVAVVPEYLVGWRLHKANMSGDLERMSRSYKLVYRILLGQGAEIPDQILRWTQANWNFDIAQQAAMDQNYSDAIVHLLKAFELDPAGSGAMLAYRLIRGMARPMISRPPLPAESFYDLDPAAVFSTDPHQWRWLSSMKTWLQRSRIQTLAALDRSSSPRLESGVASA